MTRRLYEAGLGRKEILELYRILDWLLRLAEGLEREYEKELTEFERSRPMPYITSIERMGREEGLQKDARKGVSKAKWTLSLRLLRRRCVVLNPATELKVRALSSRRLAALAEALLDFTGPTDLDRWLAIR